MSKLTLPALLGLAHGLADAAAGFLLVSLIHSSNDLVRAGLFVLVYNALGFGGQAIAGWWADRHGAYRLATLGGLGLQAAGLALIGLPGLAVLLAGLGSAAFHVGGGALALEATPGSSVGPGLFVGPGVFGLAVGSALGISLPEQLGPAFIAALLGMIGLLVWATHYQAVRTHSVRPTSFKSLNLAGQLLLLGLAAIALRSAAWDAVQFWQGGPNGELIAMGAAAMAGKLVGGWLGDRVGWWAWMVGSLSGAALLLSCSNGWLPGLLLGVGLLQSSTPLTLRMVADLLRVFPATAAGLTLGLAIAVGGLPALLSLDPLLANPVGLALLLLTAAGVLVGMGKVSVPDCIPQPSKTVVQSK